MRFQASLRDAVPRVRVDPALETPGYYQTVPSGTCVSCQKSREDSTECCERSDAGGPVGTTENSPPVHWRDYFTQNMNRVPEGRMNRLNIICGSESFDSRANELRRVVLLLGHAWEGC